MDIGSGFNDDPLWLIAGCAAYIKETCDKKAVRKQWLEDLVVSETMKLVEDDASMNAIIAKVMELQNQESTDLPIYEKQLKETEEVRSTQLAELMSKAQVSGLPEDAQAAKDLDSMCNRFEKKLHDLELTRMISIQTAPQIRLVQNNDTQMVEKIQSTIVNTIPLWKSQMLLALGVEHSSQAAAAQRQVTDMTNELLKKNAETLKMSTIETAKESERGIADLETLKATNESLISTLDEVMNIQREGREKRREAEAELRNMENELKAKLLEIPDKTPLLRTTYYFNLLHPCDRTGSTFV